MLWIVCYITWHGKRKNSCGLKGAVEVIYIQVKEEDACLQALGSSVYPPG
jgi:hypothetical protein